MTTEIVCPSLVARQAEWASLEAALDGLGDGSGALSCLLGEAGIGKSRLVTELSAAAAERGIPVLLGRAVDAGTPVPYRPLFEALAGWSRQAGPDAHPELAPFRETLSPVVPEWRPAVEPAFRASPMELGEALLRLLVGIADERGLVLVLEDLHWADPDTAAVLEYVGDNIAGTGVLCVVTARTDNATDSLRVIRALASRRAATVLELRRLGSDELTEMVQRCLGTDLPAVDVDALVQRFSDGLPFLVEELLASAIGSGSLVDGPEGWHLEAAAGPVVPQRFEDLVRRRMAQLSEEEAVTLSVAAVLGPRFDAELLPVITGTSADHVLEALRNGVAAQLLVADPTDARAFAFRHALARDALLSQLLPIERVALARRVLAAIEEHHPDLPGDLCELAATLAEHVGDRERAAELLLEAARRACARGASSSAEPTLDRAWRLARRDDAVWPTIGDLLMTVLTDTGDVDRALEVGGRLLAELPASSDRATVHLAMARAAAAAGRAAVALSAVERARTAADPADQELVDAQADVIAADIAAGERRCEDADALASSALAVAEAVGDHALACHALLVLGQCARVRVDKAAFGAFDRVIEIGREHGLPTWRLRGVMERASLDLYAFLPGQNLEAAREEAAGAGALVLAAQLDNFLAWSALDHHDPDRAEVAVERCVGLTRKLRLDTLQGIVLGAGAMAAAQRGDRDRMEQRLAEAVTVSGDHPDVSVVGPAARAAYWARRDDLPRMSAELDAAMELLRLAPHYPLPARGLWALVRVHEDRDAAASLAELGESFAVNHGVCKTYWHYAMAIALGRAGDVDGAIDQMALADSLTTPLAWFQHHSRRFVAEAALADGWGDPIAWLREGLPVFEARGEEGLAASCRRLLAKAGAPVVRRAAASEGVPDDLQALGVTARELQVLELLAEATSTKDIAARLFLSPKTVERHVSNLATKLGVSGRAGLVAVAAARPGWGPVR